MALDDVADEMRRLSTVYAGRGADADVTGTVSGEAPPKPVTGPRLVLVHGVYEGKAFSLDPQTAQGGSWVIGRKRGVAVCLDYDPFVSVENSVVEERSGGFVVSDLPQSKNGTAVNWVALPRGGSHGLRAGDLIGVGRSLLSFLPE